jgi:hypothetical protein
MDIELNISHHCIETAIRRQYHRTLTDYFNTSGDRQVLEARLELMIDALELFDFSLLRRTYPELAGSCGQDVRLEADPQRRPVIRLNGLCITAKSATRSTMCPDGHPADSRCTRF